MTEIIATEVPKFPYIDDAEAPFLAENAIMGPDYTKAVWSQICEAAGSELAAGRTPAEVSSRLAGSAEKIADFLHSNRDETGAMYFSGCAAGLSVAAHLNDSI